MASTSASNNIAPVRIGLIGLGQWGQVIARNIAAAPGLCLARAAGRRKDTPRRFLPAQCIVSNDWHLVTTADDVDGIIIATPPESHFEIATAAIDAGKAVLIEKPLTTNLAQAEALLRQATRTNAFVMVDHIHLYHPAYRALRARLATLGPPTQIEGIGGNWGPFRQDTDVLWDWGPHDVALALDLARRTPGRTRAHRIQSQKTPDGLGETIAIDLDFADGLTAHLEVGNMMAKRQRRLTVHADGTTLVYDDCIESTFTETSPEGNVSTPSISSGTPVSVLLDDFAEGIRTQRQEQRDLALGVDVVRVLEACKHHLDSPTGVLT